MSGFVSSGFSVGAEGNPIKGAFQMAIVGGTISEIGGGKFSNGAMGSAFQYLLNESISDMMARRVAFGDASEKADASDKVSTAFGGIAVGLSRYANPIAQFASKLVGGLSALADLNKQLLLVEAGKFDSGSALIDVVGVVVPVPDKVLDFSIDEFTDKTYDYLK